MLKIKQRVNISGIVMLFALTLIFLLSACDKGSSTVGPETTPSIAIDHTQVPVQFQAITVNGLTSPDDGWLVLRRGTADAPALTGHELDPIAVSAGATMSDTSWNISSLDIADGEILWVTLHQDAGSVGTPEVDGESATDPAYIEEGKPVAEWVIVESPDIGVTDKYTGSNTLVVDSVKVGGPSWIVVTTESGDIVGAQSASKGTHSDVSVTLDTSKVYTDSTLTAWVWVNKNSIDSDSFDSGEDEPDYFAQASNTITDPMDVLAPTGDILEANSGIADTLLMSQNTFVVDSLEMSHKGWLVVHEDAGGTFGPIVSDSTSIGSGNHENVAVDFDPDLVSIVDGMSVWPMLHTDNGVIEKWEFGIKPGFDTPILDGADAPVVSEYIVNAPSINAEDQPIVLDSVTVQSAMIGVDGWIVLHDNNGNIVGRVAVEGGKMHTDIGIELTSNVSINDMLMAVLHIDTDPFGEFFYSATNNAGDIPEVFGFDLNGDGIIVQDTLTVTSP